METSHYPTATFIQGPMANSAQLTPEKDCRVHLPVLRSSQCQSHRGDIVGFQRHGTAEDLQRCIEAWRHAAPELLPIGWFDDGDDRQEQRRTSYKQWAMVTTNGKEA